jgi:Ulp1 family protease
MLTASNLEWQTPARYITDSQSDHKLPSLAKEQAHPPRCGLLELARADSLDPDLLKKLVQSYPEDKIVVLKDSISIDIRCISCLKDTVWLNSEVIAFFLEWWREKSGAGGGVYGTPLNHVTDPKCWFTNTYFFTELTKDGVYNYSNVRRWTSRMDMFQLDKMIIPINIVNQHWCLAVINFREKLTEVYDSMYCQRQEIHDHLRKWLRDEYQERHKAQLALGDWKINSQPRVPKQNNDYDCGVFMCLFAAYSSIDSPFNFTQRDISLVRQYMVQIIYKAGEAMGYVNLQDSSSRLIRAAASPTRVTPTPT